MKALCIYNPNAGNGKAAKQLEEVTSLFKKYEIEAHIMVTEYPHHATKIISEVNLDSYDALLIAGGDGSVFDAVNAYIKYHRDSQIPMGIIPVGTGNSLSKDIYLKNNSLEHFIKVISQRKIKALDVGKVQTQTGIFYFVNMLGFGFTSDVTLTGIKYKFLGSFAYTLGVLLNVVRLKSYPLQLLLNGQKYHLDNTYVSISNSKFAGGNMLVAPKADMSDGLLDIVVVNKVSRWQLLKTFPKIFNGSYIHSPFVRYYQTEKISFTSNHQKILSPDGEIMGQLPAEISILPKSLPVFVEIPEKYST